MSGSFGLALVQCAAHCLTVGLHCKYFTAMGYGTILHSQIRSLILLTCSRTVVVMRPVKSDPLIKGFVKGKLRS